MTAQDWYLEMADRLSPVREGYTTIPRLDPYGKLGVFLTNEECARLAAHFGRLALRPEMKPWIVVCPDCDHGVRGGQPCELCAGRGTVDVVKLDD